MNYDEKEDYNFMGSAEETKEQPGENVNITDLMTSSPIMNKKKILLMVSMKLQRRLSYSITGLIPTNTSNNLLLCVTSCGN